MEEQILEAIKDGDFDYLDSLLQEDSHWLENPLKVNDQIIYPLHYACTCNELDIVQLFLEQIPALIQVRDTDGLMPLHVASKLGNTSIVSELILNHADLNAKVKNPGNKDNNKTALTLAMENHYYDTANELILQLTANKSKKSLFHLIKNGQQALEMLKRQPTLIRYFLRNPRISALITANDSCRVTQQRIEWYKPEEKRQRQEKRLSFFACIEKREATMTVFTPYDKLGQGTSGLVRLFRSKYGQKIAVKSPVGLLKDLSDEERDEYEAEIKREAKFNQYAYPEDGLNNVFSFTKDTPQIYTNRFVMPFVPGKNVLEFIIPKTYSIEIAQLILEMAKELHELHNLGIVHGDLNPLNIMVQNERHPFSIRFIDFGLSYWVTETRPANLLIDESDRLWLPPEVCGEDKEVVPIHASQDVYSFGYMLDDILSRNIFGIKAIVLRFLPPIQQFITQSQALDPGKRPSLESFINNLEQKINSILGLPACSSSSTPEIAQSELELEPEAGFSKRARMG